MVTRPLKREARTTIASRAGAFALVTLAFAAFGCRHREGATGVGRAVDSSPVVAKVGDAVITVHDVEARINKQPSFARARYADPAKKRLIVEELVQHEVLAAEAARRGYDIDPDVQRVVKQQMISRLVQQEFEPKVTLASVSDGDVEKYYNEHPAEFHQKAAVGVRAIFVKNKGKADHAYAEVQALPKDPASLEEQQERFQELVTKYSDVPESTSRAADLLSFSDDSKVVPSPVVEAAFKLKTVGDVAPPIKTGEGWAVILLTQKRPGIDRPLPEVKRQIQQRLFHDLRPKALNALVEDLMKKRNITRNEANLSKVVVEAAPGQASGLSLPGPLGAPINAPPGAVKRGGEDAAHR